MKKLLLPLLFLNLSVSAQTIFEKLWTSDFNFFVNDVAIDDQGSAYFACSGYNAAIDSSVSVVVKTNADYEIEWSNWYRVYRRDDLGSIEILDDGNLLLGGTMRQDFAFDVGGGLIKINPDGEVIWKKVVPGAFDERVIFTNEQPSGDILSVIRYGVSGQASSVLLTSASGSLLSNYRLFDGGTGLQIEDVAEAENDSYYATGEIFDSEIGYNLIFIAYFTDSDLLWFRKYDFGESTQANAIAINANHELSITGLIVDPESVFNGNNAVLLKTDSLGEVMDAKRIFRQGNGFSEFSTGSILRDDGSVVISFFFQSDTGGLTVFAEFTSDGTQNWISAIENGEGASLALQSELGDGRTLLAGSNFNGGIVLTAAISDPGEFACNNAPTEIDVEDLIPMIIEGNLELSFQKSFTADVELEVIPWPMDEIEICSFTVSTSDKDAELGVKVYPNPTADEVALVIPQGYSLLEVSSLEGKLIYRIALNAGGASIDLRELNAGVYLFNFSGSHGKETHRVVKK